MISDARDQLAKWLAKGDSTRNGATVFARKQQSRQREASYSVAAQHRERISRCGESLPFPDVVHEGLRERRRRLIVRSFPGE